MIIRDNMTMEEIIHELTCEYGDSFNWYLIPLTKSTGFFVDELKRELGEGDNIFSSKIYAVAKCESNDDVLFLICDDSLKELWRIYHLTYSSDNSIGFPKYAEFTSRKSVADFIQNQYVAEFL